MDGDAINIDFKKTTFVFFDKKQKSEIEFYFDFEKTKLLVFHNDLICNLVLNDQYIAVGQPSVEGNFFETNGIRPVGIEIFYD